MMLSVLFSEILLFEPQASLGFLDFLLLLFLCQDKKSKELRREMSFFWQIPNKVFNMLLST